MNRERIEYQKVREEIAAKYMKEVCSVDGGVCDDMCPDICDDHSDTEGCLRAPKYADLILSITGVAILANDQSLPSNPNQEPLEEECGISASISRGYFNNYAQAQQDMIDAGFGKVVK